MAKYTLLTVAFFLFGASFALKALMSLVKLTQLEYFVNSGNLKDRLIPLSQAIEQSQNIFKPKTEIHSNGL